MSVNIAELRAEITELLRLSREVNAELPRTREEAQRNTRELRRAIGVMSAYLSLVERMNLPPDVEAAVAKIRRALHAAMMIYMSYAAANPLLGIPMGFSAAFGLADTVGSFT